MQAPRDRRWFFAQIVITAVVVASIAWQLRGQWREFRNTPLVTDVHWEFILLSGAVVVFTYGVLIETWRRILTAWGETLPFAAAVRITCISKLGIYVPGKLWAVGAMGVLAQRENVSAAAAAGSAIVSTVVNIAVGMAVALIAGWRVIQGSSGGGAIVGAAAVIGIVAGLLMLPALVPLAVDAVRRMTGKELKLGAFPRRAVYIAIVGNVIAWLLYGVAFQLFVRGILGTASGPTSAYVAAYAWSYVMGYLAFVIPGGLGVREIQQTAALVTLGLATAPQAGMIAVTSRLWLSVMEIVPGLYFWARRTPQRSEETNPRDGSKP